jgi:hypothetical protein
MKNTIELYIDALISVTDLNAYERYNLNNKNEERDITTFERRVYTQDIIDVFKNNEGFTIITFIEEGEKKEIKVLEDCEMINDILGRVSSLNDNNEIKRLLMKKIKEKK